ncbi:MAG: hypothetical protein P4L27_09555 [Ignavibacteriaceae bacterium]|nr:hypothetical protein [Ignavibacteriaceae bacterium]
MKIASIDIGTNTVILLIAEIKNQQIITIKNEYRMPRIGQGLVPGNNIKENKIQELLVILSEFSDIIKLYNCKTVLVTATNAFRISANSSVIINTVKNKLGIQINIVHGKKEAEYSFLGGISGLNKEQSNLLVIDIGGGSTELIYGNPSSIVYSNSFQTGVVSGTEHFFIHDPPLSNEINKFETFLSELFINLNIPGSTKAIAIAGTPTTLACIQKGLDNYNEDEVEGSILKLEDINKLKGELSLLSSNEIGGKYKQVIVGREDIIFAGTIILYKLMNLLNLSEVIVSTRGIRYGAIVDFLKGNY